MSPRQRWLLTILLLYLFLAWGYSLVNPVFESPDEDHHYFTAETIAHTRQLPYVGQEPDQWMRQEAAQPPLYYLLAAVIIASVDTTGARDQLWFNPHVRLGDGSSPDNTNRYIHPGYAGEAWPWHGYALAVHLLRGLSAFFGLGTLLCLYFSARLCWPAELERPLFASALVAFLPQFAFVHSYVSNDPLIIFLCAAALWQLLRLSPQPMHRPRLLALGVTIGLAALTKNQGILLLFLAQVALFLLAWRDRRLRQLPQMAFLVLLPAVLLAGWLWWRNWTLYGDITASNQFVRLAGGDRHYTLWRIFGESSSLWRSGVAVFGWMNVRPPGWLYWLWDGLVLAAVLRTSYALFRRLRTGHRPYAIGNTPLRQQLSPIIPSLLMAFWFLLVYAGLVFFMMKTSAAQGRLLYPALLPLALALTAGLGRFRQRWLYLLIASLALATSLYSLLVVVPRAYARPPLLTEAELPADAARYAVPLGQGVQLVASRVETAVARPGEWVWITLYWRAEAGPVGREAPQYVLELFGRHRQLIAKSQGYHGGGRYPATLWPAGQIVADRVGVRLFEDAVAPVQAIFNVKLVNGEAALDVGTLKVTPAAWPAAPKGVLAELEGIQLTNLTLSATEVRAGEGITITAQWHVLTPPGRDLTTFVHLGDPTQPPLAQADRPPLAGEYPTRLWAAGELLDDAYFLLLPPDLPPGRYPIQLGLYEPASGLRLPLLVDGQRPPADAYEVGWIDVYK